MFHKEGAKIIFITLVIVVAIIFLADAFINIAWLQKSSSDSDIYNAYFSITVLQKSEKKYQRDDNHILSPVDGKVVVIEEVFEKEYFNDKRLMVSVFMNPLNVHVTRYAFSGEVKYSKYHPGKYLVAWHPKASEENERTTIVIDNKVFGEVMYRQIAGALAKRIVNYAKEGTKVLQGTDAGFIKFGSRVDLYLPIGTEINVKLGEKAVGGITIIAKK